MADALLESDYPLDPLLEEEMATVGEDERVEVTNLYERHTGLTGVVFISSRVTVHGPRVKYYLKSGKDNASYSVSIAAEPRILASSMSSRDLNRTAPAVLRWVKLNHQALLRFWSEAEDWTVEHLVDFVAGLEKA